MGQGKNASRFAEFLPYQKSARKAHRKKTSERAMRVQKKSLMGLGVGMPLCLEAELQPPYRAPGQCFLNSTGEACVSQLTSLPASLARPLCSQTFSYAPSPPPPPPACLPSLRHFQGSIPPSHPGSLQSSFSPNITFFMAPSKYPCPQEGCHI